MSSRQSSTLLLIAGSVAVVLLIARAVRPQPPSASTTPEAPVLIQPPQEVSFRSAQSGSVSPANLPSDQATPREESNRLQPQTSPASPVAIPPNASEVARISRTDLALEALEGELGNGNPKNSGSADDADRFQTQPSPLEKEDNVRAGIVFTVDKETKKVKVEKNTFGRIVDALNARKTESDE